MHAAPPPHRRAAVTRPSHAGGDTVGYSLFRQFAILNVNLIPQHSNYECQIALMVNLMEGLIVCMDGKLDQRKHFVRYC